MLSLKQDSRKWQQAYPRNWPSNPHQAREASQDVCITPKPCKTIHSLSQWPTFKLLEFTYVVGKIKFKLLFHGSFGWIGTCLEPKTHPTTKNPSESSEKAQLWMVRLLKRRSKDQGSWESGSICFCGWKKTSPKCLTKGTWSNNWAVTKGIVFFCCRGW